MGNILDDWFGIEPPKAPTPAPPAATAQTQQQFNTQTAEQQARYNLDALRTNISANRLNQTTPFGSLTYSQTGTDAYGNPTYTASTAFSPENQALLELLQGNRAMLGDTADQLISSLNDNPIYYSSSPDLSSAIQPMMDRQLQYLDPYFQHQLSIRENELRNRGLQPGNPAYDQEIRTLMQQQDSSVGNYLNTFTNTAMDLYKLPLSTIEMLMRGGGPVTGDQSGMGFVTPPSANLTSPTVGGVDYASMVNQQQQMLQKQYEQQMMQYNAGVQTLGAGLGTILGAPSGTLLGNATGSLGAGLGNLLGLNTGNASSLPLYRGTA